MKTMVIGSFLVLFALVATIAATAPTAFADHATASVSIPAGTSVPGCEETNECYIPAEVTVDAGGEVTWSNDDTAAHTVTSGDPADADSVGALFDSGLLLAGTTYSWKFEEVGTVDYFCIVHPWMKGVVVVQEAMAEEEEHKDDHMEDDHMEHMDDEGHLITDASATGMLSDGTEVKIWTSEPMTGERMDVHVEFVDAEHVNHDITVTQNGEVVMDDTGAHHHEGSGMHETAPLSSDDPVDITVTFQGYGINAPFDGPVGEEVVFTNVVPEFGTIAMMILAVAIISIIAVTSKTRVIPRL